MLKKGYYKHFKGNVYEVLGVARHSENLGEMVIYRATYDGSLWVRPLDMWEETLVRDGQEYKRFTYIGDEYEGDIK